jgi:O-antigen ligase
VGLGDAVVSLVNSLSGVDRTADFNVLYRQELLKTSLALIRQSPWFGVPDYMSQMQSLRQGDGIIDLVNTYLVVLLNVGVFGLLLFLLPYVIVLWKQTSAVPEDSERLRQETLAWLPLTLAILAAVFTVSPISIIHPILIWVLTLAMGRLHETSPERSRQRGGLPAALQFAPSANLPR